MNQRVLRLNHINNIHTLYRYYEAGLVPHKTCKFLIYLHLINSAKTNPWSALALLFANYSSPSASSSAKNVNHFFDHIPLSICFNWKFSTFIVIAWNVAETCKSTFPSSSSCSAIYGNKQHMIYYNHLNQM